MKKKESNRTEEKMRRKERNIMFSKKNKRENDKGGEGKMDN